MRIETGRRRAEEFDQLFGVDTAGFIHPSELEINSANQLHAVSYGGSDPKDFREAIGALDADYRRFAFIDFGSGKGRAILLATEFPFGRIVGLEFSEKLHRIAENNITHFKSNIAMCRNVELLCIDVTEYRLPDDPLVCYFCNPFDETIMTNVIAKIRSSFLAKPRDIFVVYYNAKEAHLLDDSDCFQRVETAGWARIWRATPGRVIAG
jgi:SAM-dependent methyltransferase